MKFYNSLTRMKEEFVPVEGNRVKMYTCGPTVYSNAHIGNMKAYIFMDQIYRTLAYLGYDVYGVMNITDVGHLTSDADEGDDKMVLASKREQKSPWEIAEFYTKLFMEDIKKLNITLPKEIVPATTVIDEIIEFVKGLLEKGYAYETSKGIYYDISKFKEYGKLGGAKLEDKLMGARIEVDEEKRNPADFALWIKAPKEHIMQWQSPWGMGYPGWHIERSAIGRKYLGDRFDIHTGGIDHRPVHHENEIAQNDALNGHKTVNFWLHSEFLQINSNKMGKSLNNIFTLSDIEKQGYSPMAFRYFLYNTHYGKIVNFTGEALGSAKNSLKQLTNLVNAHKNGENKVEKEVLDSYKKEFVSAISDDLNMPQALATTWQMLRNTPKSKDVFAMFEDFNKVLGFLLEEEQEIDVPSEIAELAEKRWEAKKARDFATADALRAEIDAKGFVVLDSKDGYKIEKK